MTKGKILYTQWLNDWRFFCQLCERFHKSIRYVDDTLDADDNLRNGSAFSNEFCDLLFTAAAEFENVAKQICKAIDPSFKEKDSCIKDFTKIILNEFPKLGETRISSPVQELYPLRNWALGEKNVVGLEWWDAYNSIKHQRYAHFSEASFQNCYNAIASLFVLELYASVIVKDGDTCFQLSSNPCRYFSSEYYFDLIWPHPKKLPDSKDEEKRIDCI